MNRLVIALTLFVVLTGSCYAEESFIDRHEVSVGYSFYTQHIKQADDLNEQNHGIAVSVDQWFAMTFNNSHYVRSWFFGYSFRTDKYDFIGSINTIDLDEPIFIRGNLHVGPLYGYGDDMPSIAGWTIGAAPTIEVGYKQVSIETMISPCDGGVVASMLKITF